MGLVIEITAIAYLLGSVPWGWLVGRLNGIEIRDHGSGNIGATNVLRVVGKPWGVAVFALDALKGLAAVRIAIFLAATTGLVPNIVEAYGLLAAAGCIIGHTFPVWLRFKGGKGVATSAGALIGVAPLAALSISLVWVITFYTTRYVSLASITAATSLPVAVVALRWLGIAHGRVLLYFSIVMAALVVWRHRTNISRLLNSQEPRSGRK